MCRRSLSRAPTSSAVRSSRSNPSAPPTHIAVKSDSGPNSLTPVNLRSPRSPDLTERPFALYQLHVPLCSGEHVAYRRFSDFVALDAKLRQAESLQQAALRVVLCGASELPSLPPKTAFWEDTTSPAIVSRRWGALQLYLDAALDSVLLAGPEYNAATWNCLKQFLNLA